MTGCANEYNQVYKAATPSYKYEYAKQCFAQGKYSRAIPLLQDVVTMKKGSTEGEECLYMLAMAEYGGRCFLLGVVNACKHCFIRKLHFIVGIQYVIIL